MSSRLQEHLYQAHINVLLQEAKGACVNECLSWIHVLSNLLYSDEILFAGESGAIVNALSGHGDGVMAKVLNAYSLPMLRALLDIGLDPNQKIEGLSPLFKCMRHTSVAKLKLLIDRGSDPNACKNEYSVLYHALFESNFKVARALYPYSDGTAGSGKKMGTLLHAFLEYRHFSLCPDGLWLAHQLVRTHRDLGALDQNGNTLKDAALHLMSRLNPSRSGHITDLLSAYIAGRDLPSIPAESMLFSEKSVHLPALTHNFLPDFAPQKEGVMKAKNKKEIRKALKDGWRVDATDDRGRSIFWNMANKGNKGGCRYLIKRGAKGQERDCLTGETVLHKLCQHSIKQVLEDIISMGADFNAVDIEGKTPLSVAVENGQVDMIKCLLGSGADPYVLDTKGRNLIELLSECRDERRYLLTLDILLDKGVDPSALLNAKINSTRLSNIVSQAAPAIYAEFQASKLQSDTPKKPEFQRPRL